MPTNKVLSILDASESVKKSENNFDDSKSKIKFF